MNITFCGHSNYTSNFNDKKRLLDYLEDIIQGKEVDFYLGGYGNFDSFALKCVKLYKEVHSNSKIIYVAPYLDKWLDNRRDMLKKLYDIIIYPDIENVPKKLAIIKRNEWMIDKADFVIAYVNVHFGGAYNSLLYASKQNKPFVNLCESKFKLY